MQKDTQKVFIRTMGCQMNVRDAEVVSGLMRNAGFDLTEDISTADVAMFVTCSVRANSENKVWSEIGRAAKDARDEGRDRPLIGLLGCMAQNYREEAFERSRDIDFVVGPADIDKIPGIVQRLIENKVSAKRARSSTGQKKTARAGGPDLFGLKIWETDGEIRPEDIYHTGFHEDKDHAFVVISEGCDNFCSYCIVPYVRGPLRHRKADDILREIMENVGQGITKITLLGQNVNSYVSPGSKTGFVRLLEKVNEIEGLKEFSFVTSHPKDASEEIFKAMADCAKLIKYLHLPFQAGSDAILKAMNRGYTRKVYLALADAYRRIVPDGRLTTDIIVGFPGETKEDFRQTFDLVKEVEFDAAFIFKYSPRPKTAALGLVDDVPRIEKERRHKLILDLQKSISLRKRESLRK